MDEPVDRKTSRCNRQLVAAIDFGTTYSGYAYSFKHEWTKVITNHWHGGEYLTHKAPTALLLNPDKSFFKFGFDAENEYARLSEDNNHKDYYFFHRFKLILKSNLEARVHRKTTCTDESGKELEALTIFTYCIRYLKDHLLDSINKKITGSILSNDIEFVITVPAIWDDTAKMFMREAAKEAGIHPNQLTIALEPEAASLYCQYMHFEEDKSDQTEFQDQLCAGWKYMVADLGGGTADFTVHERSPDGTLKEVIPASGGSWGGTAVDDAYLQFYNDLLGEQHIKTFKQDHMEDFVDVFRKFEVQKRQAPSQSDTVYIRIPLSLSEILEEDGDGIAAAISKSKYKDQVSFDKRTLKCKVPYTVFQQMFEKTSKNIQKHIQTLFENDNLKDVRIVLMVGGFSECDIIQKAVREVLEAGREVLEKKRVIIPEEAGLSVLKGAVYLGHVPDAVATHVSRYTYGVQTWPIFDSSKHPNEKKIIVSGEERCKDVFMKFICKGDQIKSGHKKSYILEVLKADEDVLECGIFVSQNPDPVYTDDEGCAKLGVLPIKLPTVESGVIIDIEEVMSLGDTEVKMTATELHTFKEYNISFDLLSDETNLPN